jgi:hypothetical protein
MSVAIQFPQIPWLKKLRQRKLRRKKRRRQTLPPLMHRPTHRRAAEGGVANPRPHGWNARIAIREL